MFRWYATDFTPEWQFGWFCKTQFAGKHGPAHFIRATNRSSACWISAAKPDWMSPFETRPVIGRSGRAGIEDVLRRSEAMLAAFGGLLKDMTDSRRERKNHVPHF